MEFCLAAIADQEIDPVATNLDIDRVDKVIVIKLTGRLDGPAAPALDHSLLPLIGPGATVLLDLGPLTYVSSAGLRVFLKAAKQAKAANAGLALCGINRDVQDVFDISGFTAIFSIYPDRDQAVSALI